MQKVFSHPLALENIENYLCEGKNIPYPIWPNVMGFTKGSSGIYLLCCPLIDTVPHVSFVIFITLVFKYHEF